MSKILSMSARVRVPRGHEHFWQVIRQLDQKGAWTTKDVDLLSNAETASIRDYVRRLASAGYIDLQPLLKGGLNAYRIAKPSRDAPRLRRDGSEIAEPLQERLWRAMKLVKTFSSAQLASSIEPAGDLVATDTYCRRLAVAGVLAVVVKGKPRGPKATYRLHLDSLGPIAPKVLATKLVYDPNNHLILGAAEAKEVG